MTLLFQPLQLQHLPVIRPYLHDAASRICDETVGTLFMWRKYYSTSYALYNDSLILQYQTGTETGTTTFALVSGKYNRDCINAVCEYCQQNKLPTIFTTVTGDDVIWMKQNFPLHHIQFNDDWADYLYDANTMISLQGSSFGGQRNHIHQFQRKYPDASTKIITSDDKDAIDIFLHELQKNSPPTNDSGEQEYDMIREVLDNGDLFDMTGMILYYEPGKIGGITLGEIRQDTLYVHVEKADKNVTGIYPALTNSYARIFADRVTCINREEDMGNPGLRRSKQSYQPIALLRKYIVELGE